MPPHASEQDTSIDELVEQLRALGVCEGDVLLAHVSFRAVRPVEGGPDGLIEALTRSVGPNGTLVMPSWTDTPEQRFDPGRSEPSSELGVVARLFWRLPGVMRSRTPFAFAARGPDAAYILSSELLLPPHQPDSPVGKVVSRNGRILLLGLNHDSNTTLHLAELLAEVPYRQARQLVVFGEDGPSRRKYLESRHCFRLYARADDWLDEVGLQARGRVGRASARLVRAQDLVELVVARLRRDPFSFLHPRGAGCLPCEAAWRSIEP